MIIVGQLFGFGKIWGFKGKQSETYWNVIVQKDCGWILTRNLHNICWLFLNNVSHIQVFFFEEHAFHPCFLYIFLYLICFQDLTDSRSFVIHFSLCLLKYLPIFLWLKHLVMRTYKTSLLKQFFCLLIHSLIFSLRVWLIQGFNVNAILNAISTFLTPVQFFIHHLWHSIT